LAGRQFGSTGGADAKVAFAVGSEATFVLFVFGAALFALTYAAVREVLSECRDDRYARLATFWTGSVAPGRSLSGLRLRYAVAFFCVYGVWDLIWLVVRVIVGLFVVFALMSPFWRYVFFRDVNLSVSIILPVAAISLYSAFRLRCARRLCILHKWSEALQCTKCGKYHENAVVPTAPSFAPAKPPRWVSELFDRAHRLRLRAVAEVRGFVFRAQGGRKADGVRNGRAHRVISKRIVNARSYFFRPSKNRRFSESDRGGHAPGRFRRGAPAVPWPGPRPPGLLAVLFGAWLSGVGERVAKLRRGRAWARGALSWGRFWGGELARLEALVSHKPEVGG
jgi:hypothetical protein